MMAFLIPDKIRQEKIGNETICIKEKIVPVSFLNPKDLIKVDCPAYAKAGVKMKPNKPLAGTGSPKGIVVHNTADIDEAPGTTDAEQYTRATYNGNMGGVLVHFYVYEQDIWQLLNETERGYHATDGSSRRAGKREGQKIGGNLDCIAIECIGADADSERTTQLLVAYLLKKYGLNANLDVYPHKYFYAAKNCPLYILPHWDAFVSGIAALLVEAPPISFDKYTVSVQQIRGYGNAANAKAGAGAYDLLDKGEYYIYTSVYPSLGMINITKSAGTPGHWINPADNIIGPVVTPPPAVHIPAAGDTRPLNSAPLYISSTIRKSFRKISGTYYLYDGAVVNGRLRITNSKKNVGKKPVGMYVTGWVDKDN